jgi:aldehyde dehydrogenase (NAD+)
MATKKTNTIKLKFDSARNLAPAPESKSAAKIDAQYDLFINGKFEKPQSKKYFATINPATEEKLSMIAEANTADVTKLLWLQERLTTRPGKKCQLPKEQNIFTALPV